MWIINRGKEFSRAKDANLSAVVAAIADQRRRLNCYYEASIKSVAAGAPGAPPLTVVLQTATGEKTVECHRIIARLGAIPPRKFVESIGIKFPNERNDAIPELSRHYESNVPGVYVIGSLAGYPLIKQAMNQGYDVVEFINGNDLKPADHPLLEYQFHGLPFERPVDEMVERFQTLIPMFRQMNGLQFRELIIESDVIVTYPEGAEHEDAKRKMHVLRKQLAAKQPQPRSTRIVREGEAIYSPGEFGTSFFTIVDGEVTLEGATPPHIRTRLGRGEFFGEMSLLSGRPRSDKAIAGPGCILVETPRRTMVKLMNSNEEVRSGIDWIFVVRELQRHFAPFATLKDLRTIAARVTLRRFKAGEVLFKEGEVGDSLFVLRSGGVALSRGKGSEQILVAEVRSGHLVGEMALMGDPVRRETATTTVAADAIEIKRKEFLELARREDARLDPLQKDVSRRVIDNARMQVRPEAGSLMNFLMREGLGEATNVLVIDESLCVGCDNCEKACAETHGGVSRLDREAGATYANVHIPTACRHCEQPHCMKDCPPNAIRRSGERRGLHQRFVHRLRQLPGELPVRRHSHGVRRAEEARPAVVAAARRQRSRRTSRLRAERGREGEGQEGSEVRCLRRHRRRARVRARMSDRRRDPHRAGAVRRSRRGAEAVIHRNLLLFRGARYLWWSLGLLVLSGVLYATQGTCNRRTAARGKATCSVRSVRCSSLAHVSRRSQAPLRSTMGSVQGWTSAHVYLGTALLIIATLHAGFQVGWNLHTLAYVLMIVVIASGFFGLYSYLNHPC